MIQEMSSGIFNTTKNFITYLKWSNYKECIYKWWHLVLLSNIQKIGGNNEFKQVLIKNVIDYGIVMGALYLIYT